MTRQGAVPGTGAAQPLGHACEHLRVARDVGHFSRAIVRMVGIPMMPMATIRCFVRPR